MDIKNEIADKINGDVLYFDKEHKYINVNDNSSYISVTTLIHNYTHEFDSAFWSAYKALEKLMDEQTFSIVKKGLLVNKKFNQVLLKKFNINVDEFNRIRNEILLSYDEEREKSCLRGTKIHSEFEHSFYEADKSPVLKQFELNADYICKPNYYELDLIKGIYPEYLISKISSDGILKVAGQIDLLIKDGNDLYIWDFKTNREIKQKSYYNRNKKAYECMKFPLNNIMDVNYYHYTLQLSLYAYLLQQISPEFNIKQLKLIHIDHDDKRTDYELVYMKDEIRKMLNHYKKQLKIQLELNKDKSIWVK